jgi:hypothetical protein
MHKTHNTSSVSKGSSVSKVTGCDLHDWGLIPGKAGIFSLLLCPDMVWDPPSSYKMSIR